MSYLRAKSNARKSLYSSLPWLQLSSKMISMLENPYIDPCIYDKFLFGQGTKNIQWGNVVSSTKVVA